MDPAELQSHQQSERLGLSASLLILLLALLPSWGTLGAPFLAEDASILVRMADAGALADWFRAQYGIEHVVRFWRPLVSSSWWLQAQLIGAEAWPARAIGLLIHAATALVLARLLLTLGLRRSAALLGGALAALFMHQGGSVTWMAGRTDLMVGLGMLLALWCALGERPWLAAGFAFLACACKEFAFLLPLWSVALIWARGWPRPKLWRALWPLLGACSLAYIWRTLALGVWDGGYAGGGSNFFSQLLPGLLNMGRSCAAWLGACLVLSIFGWWRGSLHWRLALAGLVCALGALLPILPLSAEIPLEEANERLLLVAHLGLVIVMAASLGRLPRGGQRVWLPLLLVLPWIAWNGWQAFEDTHQWARAAELAAEHETRARKLSAGLAPSGMPVLLAGVPTSSDGAYCLGLGLSDRFRAPFASAPRPIWPLRPIFEVGLREREMARELLAGELLLPFTGEPRVELFAWTRPESEQGAWLVFDERVMAAGEDLSPCLTLHLPQLSQPAWLEVMVYTELGYGSVNLAHPVDEAGLIELSLRQLVSTQDNGHDLAMMLIQGADLGQARVAYLELRLVSDSDQLLAATPWIETRWGPEFLASIGR